MAAGAVVADVAVVGGGPAGAICAALLARQGYDVVLMHHARPNRAWPELLAPEATLLLEQIGVTRSTVSECLVPCRGILDTWNRPTAEYQDFQFTRCSHGWVANRASLDTALQTFALQQGALVLSSPTPATLISSDEHSRVELGLPSSEERVVAAFLIDGTGVASRLMPPALCHRLRFDRLVATRIPLAVRPGPPQSMMLASSTAGWWYLLDYNEPDPQAIFLTDGDLVPRQPHTLARYLRGQFHEAFATTPVFGDVDSSAAYWCVRDARTTCRRRLWRGRWLPIGDAAFSMDPISGAGLTRSIEMAISASECVAEFLQTGSTTAIQHFATLNTLAFAEGLSVLRQVYATRMDSNRSHPFWQRRANAAAFMKPI